MKGSKEVTIYDVAKALNLSPSTVSRGLKNHPHIRKETRKRFRLLQMRWDTGRINLPATFVRSTQILLE
ncbi:MAG: LacI family DNA-binding transcriptional regulator [Sphingobacterium sp.]|nr:LacI family DNA-binding transcriptional regulator [Sphingobacterium sp.]